MKDVFNLIGNRFSKLSLLIAIAFMLGFSLYSIDSGRDVNGFIDQMEESIPLWLEKHNIPAAGVALIHEGDVKWVKAFAQPEPESAPSVGNDSLFQAASISKTVTAWGIMKLVEDGRLDLDAPVKQYLTRWHLPESEFDQAGVTVRRLLNHSAGISLGGYLGFDPGTRLPTIEESLSGDTLGMGSVYIFQEPGQGFSYSGGGFTILQLIIEEVTGEQFADYMQREILAPLGMHNSTFRYPEQRSAMILKCYESSRGDLIPNYLFRARAAAGLYTSISDLALFVSAAMNGKDGLQAGRGLLKPSTIETMISPQTEVNGIFKHIMGDHSGLGYFIQDLAEGEPIVLHAGGNIGWKQQFLALPGRGEGIVILTNSLTGVELHVELLKAWTDWLQVEESKVSRFYRTFFLIVKVLTALCGGLFLILLTLLVLQLRRGRRRWLWQSKDRITFRTIITAIIPILFWTLLSISYWKIVEPELYFLAHNYSTGLLTALLLLSLAGIIRALTVKQKL